MNKMQINSLISEAAKDEEVSRWLEKESDIRISWYPSSMGDISDILTFYKPDIQELVGVNDNSISFINKSPIPDNEPLPPNVFIQTSALTFKRKDDNYLSEGQNYPFVTKNKIYGDRFFEIQVIYKKEILAPRTKWDAELLCDVPVNKEFKATGWLFILRLIEVHAEGTAKKNKSRDILLLQIPAESVSFCKDILIRNSFKISHVFITNEKQNSSRFYAPFTISEEWILGIVKTLDTEIYTTNRLNNIQETLKADWLLQRYQSLYETKPTLVPIGTARSITELRRYRLDKGHKIPTASVLLLNY
jgi:hypothetical protein